MSDSTDEHSLTSGPISRRKVLSTAGKVAWAVPVITMASAVPAFAASAASFTLGSTTPTATRTGGGQSHIFTAPVTVRETNNVAATATLHVTISATTISKVSMTGGWVLSSTSGNTALLTRFFSAGESPAAATLTFTASPSSPVPTIVLSVS